MIFILVLGLIWFMGRFFHVDTQAIENSLRKFPVIYSGIIFIVLYCFVTFFIWFSKDLWLFMFRFMPLIPFRFLDLGMGLTNISFRKYLLAVVLGSPIRIFWQQYVLSGVGITIFRNPSALTEYFLQNKNLFVFSFAYVLLVILVALKIKAKGRSRCL